MTLLTLIGNREVASKELPDFEGLPFTERVKLKETIVKNEMALVKASLPGTQGGVKFVIIAASKMNIYEFD